MNILVTAIGSFSADCVISTLKSMGYFIVGCDIYPSIWHAVAKKCNIVYQVPLATKSKEYVDLLLEICEKHMIKYVIPLTDVEVDVLNANRILFVAKGIILCIQSTKCLKIARNKYQTYLLFANDLKVNVPKSILLRDVKDDCFLPSIAKPINGRSSEGLYYIHLKDDLKRLNGKDNYIIQEILYGNVFTVDYIRDLKGNDFSIPREELLRTKNGAGTTVRIFTNKFLSDIVSYIGKKIGVVGCVNMEFIYSNNKYYLIDINPRFSAGIAFSCFVGYNMVINHINCFEGKCIADTISYREQIVTKRYKEELLWIA